MIYDRCEYLLTQRGTGNVGDVGGNAELHRESAAHNTTKPKTTVGRDLLAHPLTTSAIHLYLLWTHDRPFIFRPCHVDVQEERRAPCSICIWGCSQQVT